MYSIEYAAGLLEGEGSFLRKPNGGIQITLEMTDQDIVERMALFGGNVYSYPARKEGWKPTWKWAINGQAAYDLAGQLLPYLGKRRTQQATWMRLQFDARQEVKESKKDSIRERTRYIKEMYALNGGTHQSLADELGFERSLVTYTLNGKYDNV